MHQSPEFRDATDSRSPIAELLPYVAAGLFFILIGAVTVFGPPPGLQAKRHLPLSQRPKRSLRLPRLNSKASRFHTGFYIENRIGGSSAHFRAQR